MRSDIKKKWIAALRSGEYEQGMDELRPTENSYCCLGVLACVMGEEWVRDGDSDSFYLENHEAFCELPDRLEVAASLATDQDVLSTMNDTGSTFEEIADYIEGNEPDD